MQKGAFLTPGCTAASAALLPAQGPQPVGSTGGVKDKVVEGAGWKRFLVFSFRQTCGQQEGT